MHVLLVAALLLSSAPVAAAETMSIPLRQGLTLVNSVTRTGGAVQTTLRVTSVTSTTVKLEFNGMKSDGSALAAKRSVRVQDLLNAHGIRPNFVDGAIEYFPDSTAFGTSAKVLGELRRGSSELTIDVGGLGMGTGVAGAGLGRELDGMLQGMGGFDGISAALEGAAARGAISESERAGAASTMTGIKQLQMAKGSLRSGGKTTLAVLVNGVSRQLPGFVARGRVQKDKEAYDVEWVFLDDSANPLTLRSRIGKERTTLLRIDYPEMP